MNETVLVVTNSEDKTADYLINKISDRINFFRLDTDIDLINIGIIFSEKNIKLIVNEFEFITSEIRAVWYRRPKPFKLSLELNEVEKSHAIGEWQEAIEGFLACIPVEKWINHPARIKTASYKLEQLIRARKFSLKIPETLVTSTKNDLEIFYKEHKSIILKPISHGYLERGYPENDTLIYTNELSKTDIESFPENNFCPTLFQESLVKDFDIRIVYLDGELLAIKMTNTMNNKIDIRRDNMDGMEYEIHNLPIEIEDSLINLVKSYGLRFAAIDMVKSDNQYYFLEINTNGQWAWTDILGFSSIYQMFLKAFGER